MAAIYMIHPKIFHINKRFQELEWKMFFHRIHSNQVLQQMLLFGPEYERAEHKSLFLSHQTHVDKFTMAPDNRGAHGSCYSPVGELFLEQIRSRVTWVRDYYTMQHQCYPVEKHTFLLKYLFTGVISSTNIDLSWYYYKSLLVNYSAFDHVLEFITPWNWHYPYSEMKKCIILKINK